MALTVSHNTGRVIVLNRRLETLPAEVVMGYGRTNRMHIIQKVTVGTPVDGEPLAILKLNNPQGRIGMGTNMADYEKLVAASSIDFNKSGHLAALRAAQTFVKSAAAAYKKGQRGLVPVAGVWLTKWQAKLYKPK